MENVPKAFSIILMEKLWRFSIILMEKPNAAFFENAILGISECLEGSRAAPDEHTQRVSPSCVCVFLKRGKYKVKNLCMVKNIM